MTIILKKEKMCNACIKKKSKVTNQAQKKTRNLKSLFSLKDDLHPACKICKEICSCESTYVAEIKRNLEVRYLGA